ncbi:hypothetical protein [Sulfolobus acidocaldarius]|uniref:Conserved membrane protein n=4 Tax=Sulfolobus acidocaldarius TaxID=2285 RepID=Q4JBV9_SULAC|nr:hypothetical protein [Sulfolobus acidocaldarius]AAY79720.1 conserved membrane protein [Sulfolobus acidocaldarius DSM 639]AGE70279.1 hypothetical protein SacN8_01490 [Sulfolobus acidocaldarius N8]AGE72554.1 hypothetical protein SacRon12I_01490 [Sulfolobus acidocaldarius Ron12/I]ALU29320.1 hypothetical protein ATY89_04760 [Sulfolobus acidocaldarius]ALU32049.1 hypothetical protein ATZ20_07785 [Sulfolobus acidocaldarius]
MLPQILIVILSLIEGLDPYKGLLFSYYFYSFKKVKESFVVPLLSTLSYYSLGILVVFFTFSSLQSSNSTKVIVIFLVIIHILMKMFLGKLLHYTGSMRVSVYNLVKSTFLNSILQMNVILLIILAIIVNTLFVFLPVGVFIVREVTYFIVLKKNNVLVLLTKFNFDYIYSVTLLILALAVLLQS